MGPRAFDCLKRTYVRPSNGQSDFDLKQRETRCFREAYTGLPVVRVTENQKALNYVVLNYSIPVSEE